MDRSSHVYDGIGSGLVKAYTSSANNAQTNGYDCSAYDKIVVYVSVSALSGSGKVTVGLDISTDGESFYALYLWDTAGSDFGQCKYTLSATGDYALVFPACGKFFRITTAYVSGTSLTIDALEVEGKS